MVLQFLKAAVLRSVLNYKTTVSVLNYRWLCLPEVISCPFLSHSNTINQSINQSKSLINSCQTATEHTHMNCTNKNNDKMQ